MSHLHTNADLTYSWKERPRELLPLHLAALAYAQDEIGVKEETTNWGKRVSEYLAEANIHVPAPWCAAFVNWCARQAADLKGVESPLEKVPLEALVQSYVDHGKKNGWVIPPEEAGPGDLFCLWFVGIKRYGHIGFVQEVRPEEGYYLTVEGNTDSRGSREGIEVAERKRTLGSRVIFLRWD